MKTNLSPANERGAVLVVSMLILLVLTILGIVGLNSMTLEERMAAGYQQTEVAFQASESVINATIFLGTRDVLNASGEVAGANQSYRTNTDPFVSLMTERTCEEPDTDIMDLDPSGVLGHADISTERTMVYKGADPDPTHNVGNELGSDSITQHAFSITADTDYKAGSLRLANSSQTQIVTLPGPGGGTGSDCVYTPSL